MPTNNEQLLKQLDWCIKGVKQGFLKGPFHYTDSSTHDIILSPFGAVTQKTKIRPIINLSSPKLGKNTSVNETILDEAKSVSYVTLTEIVELFY